MSKTNETLLAAGVPQDAIDRMPSELDGFVAWDADKFKFVPLTAELLKAERIQAVRDRDERDRLHEEMSALQEQNADLLAALESVRVMATMQKSPSGIAPTGVAASRDNGLRVIIAKIDAAITNATK